MGISIRKYCLAAWNFIDPMYFQFTRLEHVEKSCGKRGILRVRLTRYKGGNVTLPDGTAIQKNDLLVKIHLHNVKLLQEMQWCNSEIRRALLIYKEIQESLPSVIHYIQKQEKSGQIKGVIGITMLYKGCQKLGFKPYPISNPFYKTFKKVSLLPIYFLSSTASTSKGIPSPMYLFMSKDTLYNRYGSKLLTSIEKEMKKDEENALTDHRYHTADCNNIFYAKRT